MITVPDCVHRICSYAFRNSNITKIVVPDTVEIIEARAFYECDALEEVQLPERVTFMSREAFAGCQHMKQLILPEGAKEFDFEWNKVSQYLYLPSTFVDAVDIEKLALECPAKITISNQNKKYCIKNNYLFNYDKTYLLAYLKNGRIVTVPDGVKVIGKSAFFGKNIKEIHLPDSICRIEKNAFESCKRLQQIHLPNDINIIESGVFSGCDSLADIALPQNLKIISSYAFRDCRSLETVVIPDGVTAIKEEAFAGCCSLKTVVILDGVTSIGKGAFEDCCSLTDIALPQGLKAISSDAFRDCWSLETVVIPDGVTAIEKKAFARCATLDTVYISDSMIEIHEDAFDDKFEDGSEVLFICPENSYAKEFAQKNRIEYRTE